MARGKKKAVSVTSRAEEQNKAESERESKENKHESKTAHARSPLHSAPLSQIQKKNGTKDLDKLCSVNLVDLHSSKDESGTSTPSPAPKEKSIATQEDPKPALNKPEPRKTDRANKTTQKKEQRKFPQNNRKVTDYFPIRRSSRKTQSELKVEEQQHIEDLLRNDVEEGLKVKHVEGKGRGVFAERCFRKGQFVVEYHGELLKVDEATAREAQYAEDPDTGCYMYYFQHLNQTYCIDATRETGRLGRLVNHSKSGNCVTRVHLLDDKPRLVLLASRDIAPGHELLYDYGDRSREALLAHPWLKL